MKTSRRFHAAALALVLSLGAFAALPAAAQAQQYGALERGYRTGYSDGYQAGWTDQVRGARSDYGGKPDYASADRAYIAAYGSLEDYRDGYQQGFEVGYEAGYARQGFNSELPAGGVRRRGAGQRGATTAGSGGGVRPSDDDDDADESVSQSRNTGGAQGAGGSGPAQSNAVLTVELMNRLTTDVSQRGDRFEARVVEPQEFAGAVVAGRLTDVQRSGKARGRALLQLDFEQIRMPGAADWQEFSAQVVEVVLPSEESGVGEVDQEGGVRGKGTTKDDAVKVGAAAGIGAVIGAIAGGGKGAAIGAAIGGGAGTAGVMTQRGQDIRLEPGQQMRIRVNR
ncbi:MAG: hypothetical protein ABW250_18960 [Pyrinomonadaceae bacterium]